MFVCARKMSVQTRAHTPTLPPLLPTHSSPIPPPPPPHTHTDGDAQPSNVQCAAECEWSVTVNMDANLNVPGVRTPQMDDVTRGRQEAV